MVRRDVWFASTPGVNVQTVELQILAGGGIAGPMRELAAQFERVTGHRLVIRFGTTPELIKLATGGDPFDLGVTPAEVLKDADARARFAPGPTTNIARVGLGVAVRAGARKPDIGTAEALKQALLGAKSVAGIPASAAGAQMLKAFDTLGIAEAMQTKLLPQPAPPKVVEAVASGEAELGIFLSNVLIAPGLDLVGPFPAPLTQDVQFTAALALEPRQAAVAKAFVDFLTSPESAALIRARGMVPG
jgi:molybdate transport system substrate-binding protein